MTDQRHDDLRPRVNAAGERNGIDEKAATPNTGLTSRAARLTTITGTALVALLLCGAGPHARASDAARSAPDPRQAAHAVPAAITSAPRPTIPSSPADIWLVPDRDAKIDPAIAGFGAAVRLLQNAKYAEALPLLGAPGLASTPLARYASYFTGVAYLNLSRASEARTLFARLKAEKPAGYLAEAAAVREAEAAEAQGDHAGAAKIYEELAGRKTAAPDAILLALGRAQAAAGDRPHAAETYARLYYEFPLGDLAAVAATELDGLKELRPLKDSPARIKLEMGRAERLFAARRYAAARQAFEALQPVVSGDDAEVAALRIAESDCYLRRYRQAVEGVKPFLERASRKAEAQFFYLTSLRELGDHDEYERLARALIDAFPDSSWAEEALNNLATHYILVDEDDNADAAFRELYSKFPQGRHAERAAWKAGWWAYKHGRYQETTSFFETAAAAFPRSDYRPAFLYWSGRAREAGGDKPGSLALYRVVAADYLNSYYGRLAVKRVGPATATVSSAARGKAAAVPAVNRGDAAGQAPAQAPAVESAVAPAAPSEKAPVDVIRLLLSLDLYEPARDELLYAQRTYGDDPAITATLAWVYNKLGDYRRGIINMKRAYPTFMSAEAAGLPTDLLKVIFPIDYWPIIKRYAPAHNLDPYLVAALINQESSFLADAKSSANAIGLMQLLPSTARRYARALHVRRFSPATLTRPEVNIQIGTAYFAELVRRLGAVHYALASYNAGEHRISGWTSERPGLERDEFIDDIPFPETQAYVKKIIGTAEDYRRLYTSETEPGASRAGASKASKETPASRDKKVGAKGTENRKASDKSRPVSRKKKGTKG